MLQGTEGWHSDRAGKFTASRIGDVMALSKPKMSHCLVRPWGAIVQQFGGGKTGAEKARKAADKANDKLLEAREVMIAPGEPLEARKTYMGALLAERLTGRPYYTPPSFAQQWGHDVEPQARAAYEARFGVIVEEVGFMVHPEVPYLGASPDGLIGADGGVEFKCPVNPYYHVRRFYEEMEPEYVWQVRTNLLVTGREWWDLVSYHPHMPPELRMRIVRFTRDPRLEDAILREVTACERELQRMITSLRASQGVANA